MSFVFVGIFIGNMLSGWLGDIKGRRFPILLSYVMIFTFSLLSTASWNF